ncbi:accessory gene regulator B family protein [Paenibacillus sp. CF384]|uniref:accessory gene regulator B family protein n=1 Tax=Paenibacillus sp. CF384 TaxID=1884382 RepID=UPI000897AB29|nr:accessory gene regulator B family protein [Paenibacillus sp. CF384]SDX81728.1 accessory gene regulator B [Paenibacillus sp. CF384]
MLRKIATDLNVRMKANGVANAPSVDVIVYSLSIIWNTVSITAFSLLIGLFTGEIGRTGLLLIVFATIRLLTGGYHLKSGWLCIFVSTFAMAVMPHIFLSDNWTYILTAVALLSVLIFAPANYDKYARLSPKYYPLLKIVSAALVATNFLFVSDLLAVAFIVQALLLPFKERG